MNQNGCESKDTVKVTVNALSPPATTVTADAGKDQTICAGNSATLTATGGTSYKWSTGETTASITVSPTQTTTYSVEVSDGTSSDTDEVSVYVHSAPQAKAGSNRTIQQGEMIVLTATGGDSYLWSTGETTAIISVSPIQTTTYSVIVSKNGCTSSDQVKVSVLKPSPPPQAYAGDDLTICKGESITLQGTGGTEYVWSTGDTTSELTLTPLRTTTYTLTASRGGLSDHDEITVTVINCDLDNSVSENDLLLQNEVILSNQKDEIESEIKIYPNPTRGKINISSDSSLQNFNMLLININGDVIYSENEIRTKGTLIKREIDLSIFAKGVYILQLYNESESYVEKVMVI